VGRDAGIDNGCPICGRAMMGVGAEKANKKEKVDKTANERKGDQSDEPWVALVRGRKINRWEKPERKKNSMYKKTPLGTLL